MAEPSCTAAGGFAAAAGVVTLCGSILGFDYDGLIVGMFGGAISLMYQAPGSPWRLAGTLALASICGAGGAAFGPSIVQAIAASAEYLAFLAKIPTPPVRMFSAFGCGLFAQLAIPIGIRWISARGAALERREANK